MSFVISTCYTYTQRNFIFKLFKLFDNFQRECQMSWKLHIFDMLNDHLGKQLKMATTKVFCLLKRLIRQVRRLFFYIPLSEEVGMAKTIEYCTEMQ